MNDVTTGHNGQIKGIVDRIERLEEEKRGIASDIKDVYSEAKANGYDVRALRKVVRLRRKSREERDHDDAMVDMIFNAIGE